MNKETKMWKIYYVIYSHEGKLQSAGVYDKEYKRKGYARRIAIKRYGNLRDKAGNRLYGGFLISKTNPFDDMTFSSYKEDMKQLKYIAQTQITLS